MNEYERNLLDITAELQGISAEITVFAQLFETDENTTLTNRTIYRALFAYSNHIDRIVEDLDELNRSPVQRSVLCRTIGSKVYRNGIQNSTL